MPGTVIKNFREYKNLSQKYVSQRMGISQNAYSKIENNLTQLTVHHVKQLADIFNEPIANLLKDEFEIHKSYPQFDGDKEHLLAQIENLKKSLTQKKTVHHPGFLVIASLVKAAEDIEKGIE
jgi:transcriptional regulator with XRE-family HTH domain